MLIAGGMGMRPLMGFNQVGIDVYFGGESTTVDEAVQALLQGKPAALHPAVHLWRRRGNSLTVDNT